MKWVLGAYYYHEDQSWMIYILPVASFLMPDESDTSRAAFGQATWRLGGRLRLITGVRHTSDSKVQDRRGPALRTRNGDRPVPQKTAPNAGVLVDYGNIHSGRVNCKAGFELDVTGSSMAYATVATAYKQGGFFDGDQRVTDNTYKPEYVTSYEVGYKARFVDNHLQTNLAIFTYRYRTFRSPTPTPRITETFNAQLARNPGVELEVDWRATSTDRVGGSAT